MKITLISFRKKTFRSNLLLCYCVFYNVVIMYLSC